MTDPIRIAFSPDSDDIFMFWALLNGHVDSRGFAFEVERADTETLNARAEEGTVDIVAVSIAHYFRVARDYLLLPNGMSVGRGYGPVVVAEAPTTLERLRGARIGVPGLRTTAYLVLRLLLPDFEAVVVPISPYAKAFEALRSGDVEAALLIHEGRLFYDREGMSKVVDLGEAWLAQTGLPLPLGGNAIRRGLGAPRITALSQACHDSIAWALTHRETVAEHLLREEQRADVRLDLASLDRYLSMYANADTAAAPEDVVRGAEELRLRGIAAGILPHGSPVELIHV